MRATEHWPDALIGAVFSATPLGYGAATVLGGRLADRFPPRRLTWAAVGLLVAGFAIAFVFPSPVTFVAAYSFLALGVGGGIALTGGLGAAAQVFPGRAGTLGGLLTGTYALGAVVQVPFFQYLAGSHSWLDALRIVGVVLAVMAVAAVLLMPSLPAPAQAAAEDRTPLLAVLVRPRILAGFVVVAAATPLGAYAFVNAGLYILSLGLGPALAAAALVAAAAGNAGGRLGGGLLADVLGTNRVLIAIGICELVAALLVAGGWGPGILLGAFGCGLALGGAAGAMARMAADAAPDAPHSAFGLLFAGFALGAVAGPLAGAEIGRGRLPWLALGLLGILAVGAALVRSRLATGGRQPGPAPAPRT